MIVWFKTLLKSWNRAHYLFQQIHFQTINSNKFKHHLKILRHLKSQFKIPTNLEFNLPFDLLIYTLNIINQTYLVIFSTFELIDSEIQTDSDLSLLYNSNFKEMLAHFFIFHSVTSCRIWPLYSCIFCFGSFYNHYPRHFESVYSFVSSAIWISIL